MKELIEKNQSNIIIFLLLVVIIQFGLIFSIKNIADEANYEASEVRSTVSDLHQDLISVTTADKKISELESRVDALENSSGPNETQSLRADLYLLQKKVEDIEFNMLYRY